MAEHNPITCDLDLDAAGKHAGSLNLVHSDNRHAFGVIPIPIAVVNNGDGPTIMVTAGNHGDEYEGQVIVRSLFHDLKPEDVSGRLILLPALNYPAVLDDARVSPLDGRNMNRSFPGDPLGDPTLNITHYLDSVLFPLCDGGIDLHSGGKQAHFIECAYVCLAEDTEVSRKNLEMGEVFAAPFTLVTDGREATNGLDPDANNKGIPFISTELSGGGGINRKALEIGRNGVDRLLHHMGVLARKPDTPSPKTRYLTELSTVTAPISGIFSPAVAVGETVAAGQTAGAVYSLEELERPPIEMRFETPGVVIARPVSAQVRRGTYLYMTAHETDRASILDLL